MDIRRFLRNNYGWNEYKKISDLELIGLYKRAGYTNPPAKLIKFVSFFYNLEFKFPNHDIHFNVKRVLENNPHSLFFDQYRSLLGVTNITPFAEIEGGYVVIVADDDNNIYGICDDLVAGFGCDYYTMIETVANSTYRFCK